MYINRGTPTTNLRFADDIDGLARSEQELEKLVTRIDRTTSNYKMKINTLTRRTCMLVVTKVLLIYQYGDISWNP